MKLISFLWHLLLSAILTVARRLETKHAGHGDTIADSTSAGHCTATQQVSPGISLLKSLHLPQS